MTTEELIYLDDDKLLYLLTQLKAKFLTADDATTISDTITSTSTNTTAAGSKAVYDFVKDSLKDITGFDAVIVEVLPSEGKKGTVYLRAKAAADTDNVYDEYMWISGSWELIGTTAMDLSDYLKKTDLRPITNAEIDAAIAGAGL